MTGRTRIVRAVKSQPWPGAANLEVSLVWGRRGDWNGPVVLDGQSVPEIDGFLDVPGRVRGKAQVLKANEDKSFQGAIVLGDGFVLTPELAHRILAKTPRGTQGRSERSYADVLFPYLIGDDLNQRPDQSPSRWVINFHDWPWRRASESEWPKTSENEQDAMRRRGIVAPDYSYAVARDYPICARIVRSLVKPFRADNNRDQYREKWWIYGERRPGLQEALRERRFVFCFCRHTEYMLPVFAENRLVCSESCWITTTDECSDILILLSDIHEPWARKRSSSLKTWLRYAPSECYETFPFPVDRSNLEPLVAPFLAHRNGLCRTRGIGLTDLYNLFHDPNCTEPDIETLRDWHRRINRAVADAYNWHNLWLDYGFQDLRWGRRYTFDEATRREILDRLLELNHQRHAEEQAAAAGLRDAGAPKAAAAKRGRKPKAVPDSVPGIKPNQMAFDLDDFQLTAPPPPKPRKPRR